MFFSAFLLVLYITTTTSITHVPGMIHVRLLSTNQVANRTYRAASTVHYEIQLENVPFDDEIHIGVEIRGSNPSGGPRGYISMAREPSNINEFVKAAKKPFEFHLIPTEIYAGYNWFLRPFVFFTNESMISTNMMNSGASTMFSVLKTS